MKFKREAKLEVLGLKVPLGFFTSYHDDGFVDDAWAHYEKLYLAYCKRPVPETVRRVHLKEARRGYKKLGGCVGFRNLFRFHIHVFYEDTKCEPQNLFSRAHEEIHVLNEINSLDMIVEKIRREQGFEIDFLGLENALHTEQIKQIIGECNPKELKANLGALFSLVPYGIKPEMLRDYDFGLEFKIAKKIFEEVVEKNTPNKIIRKV